MGAARFNDLPTDQTGQTALQQPSATGRARVGRRRRTRWSLEMKMWDPSRAALGRSSGGDRRCDRKGAWPSMWSPSGLEVTEVSVGTRLSR